MPGKYWIGLLFLIFGLGFLLQQVELLHFTSILAGWWPVIVIIIGIIQIINRKHSSILPGLLFILVGGLFLANQWVSENLLIYLWPLLLIFIGLTFIFSRSSVKKNVDTNRSIHTFSFFSGTNFRSQSTCFEGGSVSAIFGGSEIDLREATISETGATLDLSMVFGGVNIYVPDNVRVEISGTPIFGGWENKTRKFTDEQQDCPVLKLNCLIIFGGVEIKS